MHAQAGIRAEQPGRHCASLLACWPQARLHVISYAGHSAHEPGIARALVAATEEFGIKRKFA